MRVLIQYTFYKLSVCVPRSNYGNSAQIDRKKILLNIKLRKEHIAIKYNSHQSISYYYYIIISALEYIILLMHIILEYLSVYCKFVSYDNDEYMKKTILLKYLKI